MQSTINERLKILFSALGIRPAQMARLLGVSPSTLHNYTDRESKPGYEVLEKLYSSFEQINLIWLFGGPGEPLLSGANETQPIYQTAKKNSGNMMGANHGTITQTQHLGTSSNCEDKLAAAQQLIEQLKSQVQQQKSQLHDKERLIQMLERTK